MERSGGTGPMLPCRSLSLSCHREGGEGEAKHAYPPPGLGRIHPVATLPLVPLLSTRPYICRKKWRSPANAVDIVHNSSHTGRCRRTTSPLLSRRDPRPTFPGRKAGMRTAFQCVFGEKNKYKGNIFFLFKSRLFEPKD